MVESHSSSLDSMVFVFHCEYDGDQWAVPSLTMTVSSSVIVISAAAASAVFLAAVLWLICRKRAGEFQIYSFITIKNRSDLTVMISKQAHHDQIVCITETCGLCDSEILKHNFIPVMSISKSYQVKQTLFHSI